MKWQWIAGSALLAFGLVTMGFPALQLFSYLFFAGALAVIVVLS